MYYAYVQPMFIVYQDGLRSKLRWTSRYWKEPCRQTEARFTNKFTSKKATTKIDKISEQHRNFSDGLRYWKEPCHQTEARFTNKFTSTKAMTKSQSIRTLLSVEVPVKVSLTRTAKVIHLEGVSSIISIQADI